MIEIPKDSHNKKRFSQYKDILTDDPNKNKCLIINS